jgi:hypothetical protein
MKKHRFYQEFRPLSRLTRDISLGPASPPLGHTVQKQIYLKKMKKNEKVSYTVSRWSALAGIDRHAVQKAIEAAGAVPVGKAAGQGHGAAEYSIKDLFKASHGDIAGQRLRKVTSEADHLEMSLRVKRGEVVAVAEVERAVLWFFTKIRTIILASPLDRREQDAILMTLVNLRDDWNREAPNL